jgi:hypothetical protein
MTAGRVWTQELLGALRRQRYRPRAWIAFLAASFARARATRAERRREHRQTLALGAAGLAAWIAVAGVRPWLALAARGETTRLGLWLDGSVDGLVLSAAAVGAGRHQLLPWWAVALVLGRHAAQWLAVTLAYFVRLAAPAGLGFVSGKLPGLAVFAGLALASLHLPDGVVLVSLGASGGLATFAAGALRGWRLQLAR